MMKKLTFWELVSIGIGGMIGGGIFAVLGLSIQLSGGYSPISFLIAGIIALLTAYSYSKLSRVINSSGGTVSFINKAFGSNSFLSHWLNIILWISYIIMISLYSYAFGNYLIASIGIFNPILTHIAISIPIILFFLVNLAGSKAMGRVEKYIVAFKVTILSLFIIVGLTFFSPNKIISVNTTFLDFVSGGFIIFLAYEGFELIANAAKDASIKSISKAFYVSVIIVIVIYFLVSLVTVGTLTYQQVINSRDYALAEAAKPYLGNLGFLLISIAALLSTSSAINATLYGSSRISYVLMKKGELPNIGDWTGHKEGLILITLIALLVSNLFNLSSISLLGSAGFLIVFAFVNFSAYKLRKLVGANRWITLISGILCFIALIIMLIVVTPINLFGSLAFLMIIFLSLILEVLLEKLKVRTSP